MNIQEIKERSDSGKLYFCGDPALVEEQFMYLDKLFEYNHLKPSEQAQKTQLLKEMFAENGKI